MIYSINTRLH